MDFFLIFTAQWLRLQDNVHQALHQLKQLDQIHHQPQHQQQSLHNQPLLVVQPHQGKTIVQISLHLWIMLFKES